MPRAQRPQAFACLSITPEARCLRHHQTQLTRCAAVEPVIGLMKNDGHLERDYVKGRNGDDADAVSSANGHNFRRILA
jgi:hypothetical protein